MTLSDFLVQIQSDPQSIAFSDTMAVIDAHYSFSETSFKNGDTYNEAGTNSGSCKLFAFAQLSSLSVDDTLACFGDYYRKDVLDNPSGDDHANIRNFMKYGWEGIAFEGVALTLV